MYRIYHLQVIRAITESRTNNMIILEACPLSRTTTPLSTVWLLLLLLLLLKVSVRFAWPTILLTLMCMLMLKIKEKMIKYFVQQATNLSIPTCKVSTTQKTLIRLYNINFVNKLLLLGHRFKWFYVNGQIKINRCLSSNLLKNNWTNMYQMKWKQNMYIFNVSLEIITFDIFRYVKFKQMFNPSQIEMIKH